MSERAQTEASTRADASSPTGTFRSWLVAEGPIVGVGMKMFLDHHATLAYLDGLRSHDHLWQQVRSFVLPSFTELEAAARTLAGSGILHGAQDCHWEQSGAFTGAVSPRSLLELGCTFAETGHAERLRWFGESWETTCRKIGAAARAGLVPLVCVGEAEPSGTAQAAGEVESQLVAALEAAGGSPILVAYEPCWAIGAAEAAGVDHVATVAERLRGLLAGRPAESAVLYGGSVSAGSIAELLEAPVDGVFIGRAATTVPGLVEIVHRVLGARAESRR